MTQVIHISQLANLSLNLTQIAEISREESHYSVKNNEFTFKTREEKIEILGCMNHSIRTDTMMLSTVEDHNIKEKLLSSIKQMSDRKEMVFTASIPQKVYVPVTTIFYKLSETLIQFNFTDIRPCENNNIWLIISPETCTVFSAYANTVKTLIGNTRFISNIRQGSTSDDMDSIFSRRRSRPAMISCKFLKNNNIQEQFLTSRPNHRGNGRCIISLRLKKAGNYNFVDQCHEDMFVLEFHIMKIQLL